MNKYAVVRQLGDGAFGSVLEAVDKTTSEKVCACVRQGHPPVQGTVFPLRARAYLGDETCPRLPLSDRPLVLCLTNGSPEMLLLRSAGRRQEDEEEVLLLAGVPGTARSQGLLSTFVIGF
ncbi:MAG: hypothetical protein BJ554DRAFT_441 [Olpidium bornovanus]|uniref:Uncharacterized protein n=1 Tax=Olpidium bornovanus TaxID=278681 RepID=A0A8H7ZTX7_9FUNG|nr:MAG: hypothetical protein BJ554DRAFT_441 [Olpidium bornovanus]